MNGARIFLLVTATLFALQSAEAQIFTNTTVDPGTVYDSNGYGTYNLSGGTLTLDGSSVFGDGTSIVWTVPTDGATLNFEPNLLAVTMGDLSLTGTSVTVPTNFILASQGTLEINSSSVPNQYSTIANGAIANTSPVPPSITQEADSYISLRTTQPITFDLQATPEPSTWALLFCGICLFGVLRRYKSVIRS